MTVHHRSATIDGNEVFYREAGPADAPAVVLLHGFPTSSFMFRDLIPRLAQRYHVIAPDHLGFGFSAAPDMQTFDYTFDSLTEVTEGLLVQLGVTKFFLYVQDYGAPIGWRLALGHPERVQGVVSQNGNAYEDGFVTSFWDPIWAYSADPSPVTEAPLRAAFELETIRWQYTTGVADATLVSPDTWTDDHALVNRPGNPEIQLALFRDYTTNRALYPQVQEWFRSSQVPLLAVWGGNDEIFGPDGARAFQRDLPNARVELLDTGHFALETHLDDIAAAMLTFFDTSTSISGPGRTPAPSLSSVRIVTDDVARLSRFYEQVLQIRATGIPNSYVELRTASATVAICSQAAIEQFNNSAAGAASSRSVLLEFDVADVDAERRRLDPLVSDWAQEPTDQPWGNRAMLFRDPDGNLVNLYTVTQAASPLRPQ